MSAAAAAASVLSILAFSASAAGFDISRNDNLAVYWGQNSYGVTNPGNPSQWQQTISSYCQDDVIDIIPIAFLDVFVSTGGLPDLNLANICSATGGTFAGTGLADCQFLAAGIEACQARGKIVTLSLGGASGAASFSSDAQGTAFANTIWDLFLGGSSSTRPFGTAVLDGVDLDIEGGGPTGFAAFVNQIRALAQGASKRYYVTAAPQCPYPDAYIGGALNAASFDAVFVQFYNNYCELTAYPTQWDFGSWDTWAKTVSPNPDVKVFIGAPAAPRAAKNGYVSAAALGSIALAARQQYSSFGGVMLWDASQAYANGRFDAAVKSLIADTSGGASGTTSSTTIHTTTTTSTATTTTISKPPTTTTTTTSRTTTTTTTTTTTSATSGSCAGVAAWNAQSAYQGGSLVTSGGHLWQAKWWSEADVPGGAAGDWTDLGPCTNAAARMPATAVNAQATSAARAAETGRRHGREFKY
ncbi:unnamed protein product [Mycena citricolor]|uniref:chitinase n=1 Tax=Mycena citricolor TaxID=2018698 RepID=A0AAD2GRA0_9AGAR|nr:unnamed protein product [Mycena citricolor]